ncbi:MAG TPA: sulfotransferase [Trueperaceae bacterium]|nr:sulfotransferase [Trueperaceae bacterium]
MAASRTDHEAAPNQQPFFVVGSDRSGTTLLRLYLNASSRLAIPSESWFLIDLFAARQGGAFEPGRVLDAAGLERAIAIVTEHPRFRDGWHVDTDELRARLSGEGEVTLPTFIDALFRLETSLPADGRWGDKTPEYALHIADLNEAFPQAQFVHIVRDGRDVYLSLASKRWRDRGHTPYELGRYWTRTVTEAGAAGAWLGPGRYLLVRYEDLVLDTRSTLERVTAFLGVEFEEAMLDAHEQAATIVTPSESTAGVHDKLFRAPRTTDVARWRESPRSVGVVLASGVMAEPLRTYHYPDPPRASVALITRNLAVYHHAWQRYAAPRLRRLLARVRRRSASNA